MTDALLNTPAKLPDPVEAAQALADLTRAAQEAAVASARGVQSSGPLPYDPAPIAKAFSAFTLSLWSEPQRLAQAQAKAMGEWTELWGTAARRALGQEVKPVIEPVKGDRRFYAKSWSEEPTFDYLKQAYLLASRQIGEFIEGAETLDEPTKAQVEFFSRQMLNAVSPSNFPSTNPRC
jgi:polyhydroxyalkanoate synthase